MAPVTHRFVVAPSAASALPGDEAADLDVDAPDRPAVEPAGSGKVVVRAAANADQPDEPPTRAAVGPPRLSSSGVTTLEVVVDGWRFELVVEAGARADIRRRATREPDTLASSGPTEIRAIIPGRIAAVRVVAGDVVEAGQSLLVVEAMKMQNELRASRAGTVERVAVGEGETIDNGDLLVVIR
jgi:biotin carboxyl carrier protein